MVLLTNIWLSAQESLFVDIEPGSVVCKASILHAGLLIALALVFFCINDSCFHCAEAFDFVL